MTTPTLPDTSRFTTAEVAHAAALSERRTQELLQLWQACYKKKSVAREGHWQLTRAELLDFLNWERRRKKRDA